MDHATGNVSMKLPDGWWRHSDQEQDTMFPNITGKLVLLYIPGGQTSVSGADRG